MVAEQAVELRDDRMLVGNRLRLELAQRSFDFCVSQSHRTLRSVSVPRVCGTRRPPLFGWLIRVVPAGPVKEFAWRVKLLPADTVVRGATMGRRAGAGRYRQPGPHEENGREGRRVPDSQIRVRRSRSGAPTPASGRALVQEFAHRPR